MNRELTTTNDLWTGSDEQRPTEKLYNRLCLQKNPQ